MNLLERPDTGEVDVNDQLLTTLSGRELRQARKDNADSVAIQKLAEAMTSDEVRKYLEENYDETAIPAF